MPKLSVEAIVVNNIMYLPFIVFIHSSVKEHSGCFYILTIVSAATPRAIKGRGENSETSFLLEEVSLVPVLSGPLLQPEVGGPLPDARHPVSVCCHSTCCL